MHDVAAPKVGSSPFAPLKVRSLAAGTLSWIFAGELVCAQVYQGSASETYPIELGLPERSLLFSRSGTWVLGGLLLPPNHFGILPRGSVAGVAAAGSLDLVVIHWRNEAMAWLESAIRQELGSRHRVRPGMFPAIPDGSVAAELGLIASIMAVISDLLAHPSRICIRPCPADTGVFAALLADVDAAPNRVWNLQEAADKAGYSPFHFSRTFKQQIGCGFHEYVDRLRAETAVMVLLEGGTLTDAVSKAGFSTARSLRESLRDYLGLLPGDLRTLN